VTRIWIGPWEWRASPEGDGSWSAPDGCVGALDLRSIPQCAQRSIPAGSALFVLPDGALLDADYDNLGTQWDASIASGLRNRVASRLGFPRASAAATLDQLIWEALTHQSDPTGDARCLPLIPTTRRRFEVSLGSIVVASKPFRASDADSTPVQNFLRRVYEEARNDAIGGALPPDHHRKILGYYVAKYGLNYRWFQGATVPDETPLPPATTITESWPTDGTTLSSGQDHAWTEVTNDMGVASGLLRNESAGVTLASIRCDSVLSGADAYAQHLTSGGSSNTARHVSPAIRFSGAAETAYVARHFGGVDPTVYRISKVVSGTFTDLGTGTTRDRNSTNKIQADGSTISSHHDGLEAESITDTAIGSGVQAGVYHTGTNLAWFADTFEAADLVPAGGAVRLIGGTRIHAPLIGGTLVS